MTTFEISVSWRFLYRGCEGRARKWHASKWERVLLGSVSRCWHLWQQIWDVWAMPRRKSKMLILLVWLFSFYAGRVESVRQLHWSYKDRACPALLVFDSSSWFLNVFQAAFSYELQWRASNKGIHYLLITCLNRSRSCWPFLTVYLGWVWIKIHFKKKIPYLSNMNISQERSWIITDGHERLWPEYGGLGWQ